MPNKLLTKNIKRLAKTIEIFVAIIWFIGRLLKIVIANRKNKVTVNKILLLLKKEYDLADNRERVFRIFRNIYKKDIPNNIEYNYREYKNLKQFHARVKKLRTLLYWISELNKNDAVMHRERFMKDLYDNAVVMVQERAKKTKGKDGTIEKDKKVLENIFNLADVYREHLEL
jgi:hypothetical protein